MPSAESFKQFVRDKLAAAAEEIFHVFHNTIVEYEEELDRHRKLFDVAWRPVVKIRRTDFPQQIVLKEEPIVNDQSTLDRDRNSSLDQDGLELPQVKEKQEVVISSELSLKQEPEDLQLCSADDKSNRSKNQTADWNPEEPLQESEVNIPVITSVVSEVNSDLSLYTGVSQSQELEEDECENSKSTTQIEKEANSNFHNSQTDQHASFTRRHHKKCKRESKLSKRQKSHDGRNPHVGKTLKSSSQNVLQHKTIDTAEKPHVCPTCGKGFKFRSRLNTHKSVHTGLRPYVCQTCGKGFSYKSNLIDHQNIHTYKRPYVCQTCGKGFSYRSSLSEHQNIHTGEKPFVCQTCGKGFLHKRDLCRHKVIHADVKPYVCQTCGKGFSQRYSLLEHQRLHTGEKPYVCQTCSKGFSQRTTLRKHQMIHTR